MKSWTASAGKKKSSTDTKFSCNLAHGLYSWMGAARDGGFLGRDFASFFSAVASSAAGFYTVTLLEDAGIGTSLVVRPGQVVVMSGDSTLLQPPAWCVPFSFGECVE